MFHAVYIAMFRTIFVLVLLFLAGVSTSLLAQETVKADPSYSYDSVNVSADIPGKILKPAQIQVDSSCPPIPYFNLSAIPPLFTSNTDISVQMPSAGVIAIRIFDITGHLDRTIENGSLAAGIHHFTWNGTSDNGSLLPSGFYSCIASGMGKADFVKIDLVR